jgi:hypothetical protein
MAAETSVVLVAGALLIWARLADDRWLDRHFLPEFFMPRPEQALALTIARLAAVAVALVLLVVVRSRLGRLAARVPFHRLVLDVAPTLAALILGLAAGELLLRHGPWLASQEVPAQREPLRRRDATLGWVSVPARAGYGMLGGRRIAYAIDPHGYRVAGAERPVDPTQPTILFTGESIMFGHGLSWAESIPAQVEAMTGVQSANLAVEGYATDQAYLRLKGEWPRFRRPVAVVALFMPSLFHRNLDTDRPHLAAGLARRPEIEEWRLWKVARRLVPYKRDREIEAGVTMTRQALADTVAMARQRGAVPLILVPQLAPETPTERALRRRILDEPRLPYVLVTVDPSWRIPNNRHPDARAAHAIARAVAEYLKANPGPRHQYGAAP